MEDGMSRMMNTFFGVPIPRLWRVKGWITTFSSTGRVGGDFQRRIVRIRFLGWRCSSSSSRCSRCSSRCRCGDGWSDSDRNRFLCRCWCWRRWWCSLCRGFSRGVVDGRVLSFSAWWDGKEFIEREDSWTATFPPCRIILLLARIALSHTPVSSRTYLFCPHGKREDRDDNGMVLPGPWTLCRSPCERTWMPCFVLFNTSLPIWPGDGKIKRRKGKGKRRREKEYADSYGQKDGMLPCIQESARPIRMARYFEAWKLPSSLSLSLQTYYRWKVGAGKTFINPFLSYPLTLSHSTHSSDGILPCSSQPQCSTAVVPQLLRSLRERTAASAIRPRTR